MQGPFINWNEAQDSLDACHYDAAILLCPAGVITDKCHHNGVKVLELAIHIMSAFVLIHTRLNL